MMAGDFQNTGPAETTSTAHGATVDATPGISSPNDATAVATDASEVTNAVDAPSSWPVVDATAPDTVISIGSDVTDGSNPPEADVSAAGTSSGRSCARDVHQSECDSQTMMLSVAGRLRRLQTRHGRWTCFFCCHVTTGTAFIAIWHVLLHLLALSLLSLALLYPELLRSPDLTARMQWRNNIKNERIFGIGKEQDMQAVNCTHMPCSMASLPDARYPHVAPDFPLALGNLLSSHQLDSEEVSLAMFITVCTLLVTLLLFYALHRRQPSHLMPFFFLQVFDFCISSMTMMSYVTHVSSLREMLQETPAFPFRDSLLNMSTNCLTFFVLFMFLSVFLIKAYCINIIWRCYKYLLLLRTAATAAMSSAAAVQLCSAAAGGGRCSAGGRNSRNPPASEYCTQWLLEQDYRLKASGAYPEPPPSYDVAMAVALSASEQHPQPGTAAASNARQEGGAPGDDDEPLLPRYDEAMRLAGAAPPAV
ncbi:uncharacterized protein LOC108678306 [Hyalella azteca]|uniref:Uncharacterized protein LOC108678306 n=1 Tax=Hyalella azteca TaxID=294128 RepID=A0A8B7P7N1_HYAAZ|nr:uncharacterized protein LOC108678306 [Hyalella azteca]